ncbi:SdpA family antimicrobial peptide system protein [Streptomyces sp. NRRL S-1448]|uniref:SdpA family antimicrobial peptide system protein n=1 Tax=Streptomyces sp. NRRL S-1448 TaxID=1463883 RepID=UPI00099CD5AD|nr:SdpA family antimicrobial peptide system protein [Streptomyces sp. NRRL S-1448]
MGVDRRRWSLPLRSGRQRSVSVPRSWILISCTFWALVVLYVAQTHLPKNVLELPGQEEATPAIRSIAAQGWSFFTKSPRDVELFPYVLHNGEWKSASLAPHSEPRNAFGLNRRSRSQGIEMALLMTKASKTSSRKCESSLGDCLHSALPKVKISNPSPDPTLCGTIAIVQQKPVPWAWRDLMTERHFPTQVTSWEVVC